MLDARLIGRFPLMQLAWIPAYAGIVHVPRDTTKDESASVRVARPRADTGTFMAMTLVEGRYSWCASIVGATLFSTKF